MLGIDEAEAFSERLKRELTALEAANVHAILESEPLVEEVAAPTSFFTLSITVADWIEGQISLASAIKIDGMKFANEAMMWYFVHVSHTTITVHLLVLLYEVEPGLIQHESCYVSNGSVDFIIFCEDFCNYVWVKVARL